MPDIGDQLRETRLRKRIDIGEVEAATKIRAKYLRALENEEWHLLPGPTFVKTFLRTYADHLGLDARNLVEEYRQRYERPSGQEIAAFGTNLGSRRTRARRPLVAPWMLVLAGLLALFGALYALGTWGDDGEPDGSPAGAPPSATAEPATAEERSRRKRRKAAPARPRDVRLQIRPTGAVSVCLENGAGEPLIGNLTLEAGDDTETFRARRFRVSFGTAQAVMRVNGKAYPVSAAAPVGYEVRVGARPRVLPEAERPTCAA